MILSYQEFRLLKENGDVQPEDISYDDEVISELLDIIDNRGYISESDLAEFFEFIGEEYGLELDVDIYEWLQEYSDLIDETSNQNGRIFSLTNRGKLALNEAEREGGIVPGIKHAIFGREVGKQPKARKGFGGFIDKVGAGASGFGRGVRDVATTGIQAGGKAYKAHVKANNKMDARAKRHEKFTNWQQNRQDRKMAKIKGKTAVNVARAQTGQ